MSRWLVLAAACVVACGPTEKERPHTPSASPCPPPVEPDHVAVVVGTIGKLHLVESRYPLTRLGDALAAFKPDLVLVQIGVDPFHEGKLEDGSFEMTYATHVAKQRGVAIEPIGGTTSTEQPLPAVEPWDAAEIARRETEILDRPALFTFEQANGREIFGSVLRAELAQARWRGGSPATTKRRAWLGERAATAIAHHERPKRVLAYVDVFDRPSLDLVLHGIGYATRDAAEIVAAATETVMPDVPAPVIEDYRAQLARVRGQSAAKWVEAARVLEIAIEKRGACCVAMSAFAVPAP